MTGWLIWPGAEVLCGAFLYGLYRYARYLDRRDHAHKQVELWRDKGADR
jgi:hypothetical protein